MAKGWQKELKQYFYEFGYHHKLFEGSLQLGHNVCEVYDHDIR